MDMIELCRVFVFFIVVCSYMSGVLADLNYSINYCRQLPAMPGHDSCWIANSSWLTDVSMNKAKEAVLRVSLSREYPPSNSSSVFVYIHAFAANAVGHSGALVVDKLLSALDFSGLLHRATGVYLVAYGDANTINFVAKQYKRVTLFTQLKHFAHFFEYPTLALMQHHATQSHVDSKFLYLHSKGVTSFEDKMRAYLRASMIYFNIHLHDQAIRLLDAGWESAGMGFVLSSRNEDHYAGNFFWIKAQVLARNVQVRDLIWHWRFGAERWPLFPIRDCKAFKSAVNGNIVWLSFLHNRVIKDIPEFVANISAPPTVDCTRTRSK